MAGVLVQERLDAHGKNLTDIGSDLRGFLIPLVNALNGGEFRAKWKEHR